MSRSTIPVFCLVLALSVVARTWVLRRRSGGCNMTALQQCASKVQSLTEGMDGGPNQIVVDGQLSISCDNSSRDEARSCLASIKQCPGYNTIESIVKMWDNICENEQAYINGEACWRDPEFNATLHHCEQTVLQDFDYCAVGQCFRDDIPNVASCSATEADLMFSLANNMLATFAGVTC